jgi:hypothetical protein
LSHKSGLQNAAQGASAKGGAVYPKTTQRASKAGTKSISLGNRLAICMILAFTPAYAQLYAGQWPSKSRSFDLISSYTP